MQLVERYLHEAGNLENVRNLESSPRRMFSGLLYAVIGGGPYEKGASVLAKTKKDYEEKYTEPELRERLKEEIKQSDKGGKPGQWSARKSQLLAREYEKQGGYKGEKDESQKHLEKWTEEEWQTKEGGADARHPGGETKRYLPKEAWENLSEKEKEETERKKREGSGQGKQHVGNTEEAREARDKAQGGEPIGGYDDMSVEEAREELEGLSQDELKKARSYEKENKGRKTLVGWLDGKIEE